MDRFYNWASEDRARRYAKSIQNLCPTFQAMEHPHHDLNLRQDPVRIPPKLMDSVAVDNFAIPTSNFEGTVYDFCGMCRSFVRVDNCNSNDKEMGNRARCSKENVP